MNICNFLALALIVGGVCVIGRSTTNSGHRSFEWKTGTNLCGFALIALSLPFFFFGICLACGEELLHLFHLK